ncbi:MAG: SGNH/GDSL hydrolase family protein [Lachnospiraceae bacterium]|nr:SGNH/GDSL hydrolase family protein [Lachnospiraceae bacterium]
MTKKLIILLAMLSSLMCCWGVKPGTVSILGDSYSTFENYVEPDTNYLWYFSTKIDTTRTDVHDVEQTWWKQFLADNGLALEKNNSFSGSTICNTGYRGEDYSGRSFITRMDRLGDPALIIIFGATNDFWAKVPFGEDKDSLFTDADLYTFRPALSLLLQSVPQLYPDAKLCFVLNDSITGEFRQAILDKCRQYGVDCLELKDIKKRNGHPDSKGMAEISRQLTQFIKDNDYKL